MGEILIDELAGEVLEKWFEKSNEILSREDFHSLRECISDGIKKAVDLDRNAQLDYQEKTRIEIQENAGFIDMWNLQKRKN